jgi:hypothetical protein
MEIDNNINNVLNTIQWSEQVDKLLASWCDNAKCFEYMHQEAYDCNITTSKVITLITAIISTISGAANIGIGSSSVKGFQLSWIFGGLTILSSVVTVIQDKLAFSQNAEAHKRFCNIWGQIRRKIESELIVPYNSRKECTSFINMMKIDIDQVSNDGNTKIPKFIRQKCYEIIFLLKNLIIINNNIKPIVI